MRNTRQGPQIQTCGRTVNDTASDSLERRLLVTDLVHMSTVQNPQEAETTNEPRSVHRPIWDTQSTKNDSGDGYFRSNRVPNVPTDGGASVPNKNASRSPLVHTRIIPLTRKVWFATHVTLNRWGRLCYLYLDCWQFRRNWCAERDQDYSMQGARKKRKTWKSIRETRTMFR